MRNTQPNSSQNQSPDSALPSHLADDSLNASLPKRTWSEFLGETSKRVGLGTAILGAGLGLSGVGPTGFERKAEGGIIISGGNDAQYRANGEALSVFGGGNTAYLKMVTDTGTYYSSAVALSNTKFATSAHQHRAEFGNVTDLFIGTSPNFNQPELGSLIRVTDVLKHPSYTGSVAGGIDLAILTTEAAVPGVIDIKFADVRPLQNETIWFSGYGVTGDVSRGYIGQDGFIRAGTSRAQEGSPLLGGDPNLYMDAIYTNRPTFPNSLRLATGDSGGGVWTSNGELLGINIGASTSISGSTSVFLSANAPEVRSFMTTAVPEPSSFALASIAVGLGAWLERRRKLKQTSTANKQAE